MKNKKIILLSLLILIAVKGWSQIQDYDYKRKIESSTEMWHSIALPPDIYGKCLPDFSDMRIYGFTKANDTLEAPYIVVSKSSTKTTTPISFNLINSSSKAGVYYYTLSLNSLKTANHIHLNFNQKNFNYLINLQGSTDNNTWFDILTDYRILSIKNQATDYVFSDLYFNEAQYKYYRIAIPTNEEPKLKNAELYINTEQAGDYHTIEITEFVTKENEGQSIYFFETDNKLNLSDFTVTVTDTIDFYRYFTLDLLDDTVQFANVSSHNYNRIADGYLSSLSKNTFSASNKTGNRYRLTIENRDNNPLTLSKINVFALKHNLLVRFTKPANYYLVYGSAAATAPQYDLGFFKDRIPENAPQLTLDEEEIIAKEIESKEKPLFDNKFWLWSIMVLIIALLGWFTFKMMKEGK